MDDTLGIVEANSNSNWRAVGYQFCTKSEGRDYWLSSFRLTIYDPEQDDERERLSIIGEKVTNHGICRGGTFDSYRYNKMSISKGETYISSLILTYTDEESYL